MLLAIPDVLPSDEARAIAADLAQTSWVDGNATSGTGAALAKRNRQLPEGSAALSAVRSAIQKALATNATFLSAALPRRVVPPLVNRYGVGDGFGLHVDNAIRVAPGSADQIRTDLSATLFLSDPSDYDGGELIITGNFGETGYRLPAGQLLLYPASSLHRVSQVTRGERIASFFWIESLVRSSEQREHLFELDQSVQLLAGERGLDDPVVLRLTNLYHNLVRSWAG